MGGQGSPKAPQDRLLCRGGAGYATRSSAQREWKEKGRGDVLGVPRLWGLCLFLPSLLPAVGV